MSKKDSVFTRIFDLKNILEIITSTGLAAQSLFNPAGAIVLTPIIKTLVMIAVDFCDQKKSDCIDEAKRIIEGYLADDPGLSASDTNKYTQLAFECIKEFDVDSFSGVTLNKAMDMISEEVKKKYPNTNDVTYKILVNIIAYTVTVICYNLQDNDDDFRDYCIKNFMFSFGEIKRLEEITDNHEERIVEMEKYKGYKKYEDNIRKKIEQCADYFTDALYLHQDTAAFKETAPEKIVNLKNLFVKQQVVPLNTIGTNPKMNIEDYLSSYNLGDPWATLLLGDAGVGKSSIVYWLADLYLNGEDADKKKIFKDKELVIVRLRDIIEFIDNNLFISTCNFFDCIDDECRNILYKDKFVVIDGLDEIRLKDNNVKFDKILKSVLSSFDNVFRLIITSRPGVEYVVFDNGKKIKGFDDLSIFSIKPFGIDEKKEWIRKYKEAGGKINVEIIKRITPKGSNASSDNIFDYPQILYMVSSADTGDGSWSLSNEWSLYHHIFYNQIMSKEYEKHNRGINPEHHLKDNIDDIYSSLKSIAYEMFLNNYKSRISIDDLNNLLEKNAIECKKELLNNYAYRFGCYGKIDDNISEFEFYHNNIRDFFIAEYLYDGLNTLFSAVVEPEIFANYNCEGIKGYNQYLIITKKLFKLLQGIPIQRQVVKFLILRTKFRNTGKEYKDKFYEFLRKQLSSDEMEVNKPIQNFTQELWCNLQIYNEFDSSIMMSTLRKTSIFLNNYLAIVYALYSCDNTVCATILSMNVRSALNELYCHAPEKFDSFVFLVRANLRGANLEEAHLEEACLVGAILDKANLKRANFKGANLIGAHLMRADLFEASLQVADLMKTDFSGAVLGRANLFGANLQEAKLIRTDLGEANLDNANLERASLYNAFLYEAYLEKAYLLQTNLARANLQGANLSGANLQGAYLFGANLKSANLKGANLIGANLKDADLEGTDLRTAHYEREQLENAKNWEMSILK